MQATGSNNNNNTQYDNQLNCYLITINLLTAWRWKIFVFLSVDTVIQPSFSNIAGLLLELLLELRRIDNVLDLLLGSDIVIVPERI